MDREREVEPPEADAESPSPWAITYAKATARPIAPAPRGKVRIDLLTDPWSVWCWGFEPVRRAIELRYPQLLFEPLVGGMFPELPDPARMGFDIERFFAVVSRNTGMPIRAEGLRRDRPTSTYPACVNVHAVRLLAPDKERAYVRALREAAYLDGENVSRPEVGAMIANRVGVDEKEFLEAIATGEPEREFRERLQMLHGLELHAYPTFLVTAGSRTAKVEGFQPLPAILTIAESVAGKPVEDGPAPTLSAVFGANERIATREVSEALGVSVERAYDILAEEEQAGRMAREVHPGGDVWRRVG